MSLCQDLGSARSPVTKNGKPINEGKRQKTWGLDLKTNSELELDGGQGTPQASGPWDAMV